MDKIEVGDYVRTPNGNLGKVLHISNVTGRTTPKYLVKWSENKAYCISRMKRVKHSKDIMDLIEDDDIAIIEYYVKRYRGRITRRFECNLYKSKEDEFVIFENKRCDWWYNKTKKEWIQAKGFKPKIKGILTKQEFENRCIKVESEK